MPLALLEGSPFGSYLVPGVLLFGLGVLHLAAAAAVLRRSRADWFLSGLSGGGMMVWITVQVALVGLLHWAQPFYLVLGLVTGLLTLPLVRPIGVRVAGAGAAARAGNPHRARP